jgi:hypothetical protein
MELDRRGAELLFQVLTEREETASVAIASNESFSKAHMFPATCARQRLEAHRFGRRGAPLAAVAARGRCLRTLFLVPGRPVAPVSPLALFRGRPDFLSGLFAVILGGHFFRIFPEIRPTLLELVLDDAHCQVSEALGELGPERLECRDDENSHTN